MTAPTTPSETERLRAAREAGRREERERIAQALEYEASVTPSGEDAAVVLGLATLVRADFSYDGAEVYEDENDRLRAENAALRTALIVAEAFARTALRADYQFEVREASDCLDAIAAALTSGATDAG